MDKLPSHIIQHIYEYDSTYRTKFDKVLKQMMAHFLYTDVVSVLKSGTTVIATAQMVEPIWNYANRSITLLIVPMKMS